MSDFIPNSFQVPNLYVDRLMPLLTDPEWRVLCYMARRIFGFQKRRNRISLSQLVGGTRNKDGGTHDGGTGLGRETALEALRRLQEYRIVIRTSPEDEPANLATEWELQLDSRAVAWEALEARHALRKVGRRKRTAAARAAKRARAADESDPDDEGRQSVVQTTLTVCTTDHEPVCATDCSRSVPQTTSGSVRQTRRGQSDRPQRNPAGNPERNSVGNPDPLPPRREEHERSLRNEEEESFPVSSETEARSREEETVRLLVDCGIFPVKARSIAARLLAMGLLPGEIAEICDHHLARLTGRAEPAAVLAYRLETLPLESLRPRRSHRLARLRSLFDDPDGSRTNPPAATAPPDVWQQALAILHHQVPRATFDLWLRDTSLVQQEDTSWIVAAKPHALDWLNRRLLERVIHPVVRRATGNDALTVHFVAHDTEPIKASPASAGTPPATGGVKA